MKKGGGVNLHASASKSKPTCKLQMDRSPKGTKL